MKYDFVVRLVHICTQTLIITFNVLLQSNCSISVEKLNELRDQDWNEWTKPNSFQSGCCIWSFHLQVQSKQIAKKLVLTKRELLLLLPLQSVKDFQIRCRFCHYNPQKKRINPLSLQKNYTRHLFTKGNFDQRCNSFTQPCEA